MVKRYTGDEIHGFMFGDYRSDEPRWIDAKDFAALEAERDQWRRGSAHVNGALLDRIAELEACVLEYWNAKDWDAIGAADATAGKLLPADMKARAAKIADTSLTPTVDREGAHD